MRKYCCYVTINYKNDNGPSIQFIRRLYSKNKNDGNYEVLDRIKENIIDLKSRYLLVVSKSSASIFLLSTKWRQYIASKSFIFIVNAAYSFVLFL